MVAATVDGKMVTNTHRDSHHCEQQIEYNTLKLHLATTSVVIVTTLSRSQQVLSNLINKATSRAYIMVGHQKFSNHF